MKLVGMPSLLAIVAVAAMAFLATSSASADSTSALLCKKAELECKDKEAWPSPTAIVAHATDPKLLSSLGTVECEKSLSELTLLNTAAESILAHVLSLSFEGNCHLGLTKCTVTVAEVGGISFQHGPNSLEWLGKPVPLPLGETSMNTIVTFKCGFLINCTYTLGEETETTLTNNVEGEVTMVAEKAPLNTKAGFCPEVSEWDATYQWLGTGLWLEASGPRPDEEALLCKKTELECKEAWPNPTAIVAHATNPKLLSSVGTVECEKSLSELTLLNTAAESILTHILSLGFEGNCHLSSTKCTVTVAEVGGISFEHGPNSLEWLGKPVPLPLGETSMNTIVTFKCGLFINCTYTLGEETETTLTNNVEGEVTMVAEKAPLNTKAGVCPEVSEWDATYQWLGTGLWLEAS